jgi:D-alanyl-D-alanine carboxypeptidase/D-alanyl-D-alanine-endopeptidase (penicillin-binding protein 4)
VKTLGAELRGEGSWEAGMEAVAEGLGRLGLDRREFRLRDGSGLSRNNAVTPAAMARLLVRMQRSEQGRLLRSLLAAPGCDGTLKHRLTDAPYRQSVRAKTGYINGVGALSGYATARSGVRVAFSILVNDSVNPVGTYSMRQTVDGLCRIIVDHAGR